MCLFMTSIEAKCMIYAFMSTCLDYCYGLLTRRVQETIHSLLQIVKLTGKNKKRETVFFHLFSFFFLMFALASSFSKLMLLSNFLTAIKKTGITALS